MNIQRKTHARVITSEYDNCAIAQRQSHSNPKDSISSSPIQSQFGTLSLERDYPTQLTSLSEELMGGRGFEMGASRRLKSVEDVSDAATCCWVEAAAGRLAGA